MAPGLCLGYGAGRERCARARERRLLWVPAGRPAAGGSAEPWSRGIGIADQVSYRILSVSRPSARLLSVAPLACACMGPIPAARSALSPAWPARLPALAAPRRETKRDAAQTSRYHPRPPARRLRRPNAASRRDCLLLGRLERAPPRLRDHGEPRDTDDADNSRNNNSCDGDDDVLLALLQLDRDGPAPPRPNGSRASDLTALLVYLDVGPA